MYHSQYKLEGGGGEKKDGHIWLLDFKLGDKTSKDEWQSLSISQMNELLEITLSSEDSAVIESAKVKEKKKFDTHGDKYLNFLIS